MGPTSVQKVSEPLNLGPELVCGPSTTRRELAATWQDFGMFNGHAIGGRKFRGTSPWERHPGGDELLYVTDGSVEITLLLAEVDLRLVLNPGEMLVIPHGVWHCQKAEQSVCIWGVTATGDDEISFLADPRKVP